MNKPDIDFKKKKDDLTSSLPVYLKNPANYKTVMRQILETLATGHSHSDILSYGSCVECTQKMQERRKLLKKLGFKNPAQFKAWQRIHHEIRKMYPLVDWESVNALRKVEELKNESRTNN